ncbi:hypothetical protein BDW62DRAFT_198619 [Aspergillus aurantiobrunneus]
MPPSNLSPGAKVNTKANTKPFLTTPLTKSLLTDASYTLFPASAQYTFWDPYFRLAGHTHSAVLHTSFLFRETPTPEGHLLIHCGPGVCGQPGIAHGGFLATVVDEVCGNLISCTRLDEGLGMFTVSLGVGYRRPVFVRDAASTTAADGDDGAGGREQKEEGTVIVATARLERVEGRKVFIEAVIRDAGGEVCTTAEAIFVKRRRAGVL